MKKITVPIRVDQSGLQLLQELQARFVAACNRAAALAAQHSCYSRVTLHHLCYRCLRDEFSDLGSQLVSNAIYAVCRASRSISRPKAVLKFATNAPVFLDRHTLSLKEGRLSMITLQGRMKFDIAVDEELRVLFENNPIKEVTLERDGSTFQLSFFFKDQPPSEPKGPSAWEDRP